MSARCTPHWRNIAEDAAYRLWRVDADMRQFPYGPPMFGLRNRLAWVLYHWAIGAYERELDEMRARYCRRLPAREEPR